MLVSYTYNRRIYVLQCYSLLLHHLAYNWNRSASISMRPTTTRWCTNWSIYSKFHYCGEGASGPLPYHRWPDLLQSCKLVGWFCSFWRFWYYDWSYFLLLWICRIWWGEIMKLIIHHFDCSLILFIMIIHFFLTNYRCAAWEVKPLILRRTFPVLLSEFLQSSLFYMWLLLLHLLACKTISVSVAKVFNSLKTILYYRILYSTSYWYDYHWFIDRYRSCCGI